MPDVENSVDVGCGIGVYLNNIYSRLKMTRCVVIFVKISVCGIEKMLALVSIDGRSRSSVEAFGIGSLPTGFYLYEEQQLAVFGNNVKLTFADVYILPDDIETALFQIQRG